MYVAPELRDDRRLLFFGQFRPSYMQGVSRDELHDQFALLGMVYALLNSIYFWDRYRSRRTDKLGRFSFSFQDNQPAAPSNFTGGDARNVFCDSY